MWTVIDNYLGIIREILQEGIASGYFRHDLDSDTASIAFFGLIQSMVSIWSLSNYKYSLERYKLFELFKLYKRGIDK